jgi:hypothetical protein
MSESSNQLLPETPHRALGFGGVIGGPTKRKVAFLIVACQMNGTNRLSAYEAILAFDCGFVTVLSEHHDFGIL